MAVIAEVGNDCHRPREARYARAGTSASRAAGASAGISERSVVPTIREAAEALQRPERTMRWKCAKGFIPGAVRIGWSWFIPVSSVEALRAESKESQ